MTNTIGPMERITGDRQAVPGFGAELGRPSACDADVAPDLDALSAVVSRGATVWRVVSVMVVFANSTIWLCHLLTL